MEQQPLQHVAGGFASHPRGAAAPLHCIPILLLTRWATARVEPNVQRLRYSTPVGRDNTP
eukprot:2679536-Alexandrium_andersonii.AAC.1